MRRLIGSRCKRGNTFSRGVLIGPDLQPFNKYVSLSNVSVNKIPNILVVLPGVLHLFPSRTQQLSLLGPMVVLRARVGSRQYIGDFLIG